MNELDNLKLIGKGSNSKIYSCYLDGKECAVKVPHDTERFISCALQVDSLRVCQETDISFVTPQVIRYDKHHDTWGEMLIMERLNSIYPVSFLMRNGMVERELIINCAAKAIAELHSLGISGFDVEFYWSFEHNKLALLDIGPRYTIGYASDEMVGKHYVYAVENQNWMTLWNLVSELIDSNEAIPLFHKIVQGNKIPQVEQLQNAVSEVAEQEHIQGVARNHYLQLIGDCPSHLQEKMKTLFIKKYFSYSKEANFLYAGTFVNAGREGITSSTVCLYYSKYNTLSKMSNFVSIT